MDTYEKSTLRWLASQDEKYDTELLPDDGTEPIIQYYFNRYSTYPTKAYCPPEMEQGPEERLVWQKCSFNRGLKRYRLARETDFFHHFVVLVTGNESYITAREAFVGTRPDEWQGFVKLTLNLEGIFGRDSKESATRFLLSLFADAMNRCVDESMRC